MRQPDSKKERAYKRRLAERLGAAITRLRSDRDEPISQRDLSTRAGMGISYLRNIEAGRKLPPYRTMHRLAIALGTMPSELLAAAHEGDPALEFLAKAEALAEELEAGQ